MSKILPTENLIFKTKLTQEQVILKLNHTIEVEKSFRFGFQSHSKPYTGTINGNSFEVKRVISYRNSFLPIIKGEVFSEAGGTKIRVSMKPHGLVLALMIFWFSGTTIACIASVFTLFAQKFEPAMLVPFGMFIFGIVLFFGAFKTESSISKEDFKRILEAEVE